MNKISCEIIRDLLPLYIDEVCSNDSKCVIEEHIGSCNYCKEEYEQIKREIHLSDDTIKENIREGEYVMSFPKFMKKNNKGAYLKGFSLGLLIAIAITIISFYLFPLLIIDTGSGMFILLLVIPIVCFVSALVYGCFAGFKWFYPIIVAMIFVPTIFIYFNSSAFIYVIIYAAIAFIGDGIGGLIHKYRKSS
jgi:hypothetical protein